MVKSQYNTSTKFQRVVDQSNSSIMQVGIALIVVLLAIQLIGGGNWILMAFQFIHNIRVIDITTSHLKHAASDIKNHINGIGPSVLVLEVNCPSWLARRTRYRYAFTPSCTSPAPITPRKQLLINVHQSSSPHNIIREFSKLFAIKQHN